MNYEILFDEEPIDFLNTLDKPLKRRIYDKIMTAGLNPHHFFERLAGRKDYKLKVGKYRIIADIYDSKIHVTHIGLRKNVYK